MTSEPGQSTQLELAVARTLAEASSAAHAYEGVMESIGTALGWELGAVWEVDPSGRSLRCVAVWHAPGERADRFVSLSERMSLARGEGLPGRVWDTGQPAWIADVGDDDNFPRSRAAADAGLTAAVSFPIRGPRDVVGTMEFFARELQEPDDAVLASTAVLGRLIGQFVVRRRAEAASLEDEATTQAVLGAALDAVITMDARGCVLEFNPAAEQMFGYVRADTVGKDMAELIIPPSLRDAHRRGLERFLQTGRGSYLDNRIEIRGMRADGREFPVELTITQIELPGEAIFTGFIRDVTDRKRVESELAASRARLVETADTERRRLERNLHDGAQQHLVALALKLAMAAESLPDHPKRARRLLDETRADLALALAELRELARGIHPAVLSERGLAAALTALADRSNLQVELGELPSERLPERVEVAAYFVVSEALTNVTRYAEADDASVSVTVDGDRAVVKVVDKGRGGASMDAGTGLRGLADRVEALGGKLTLDSPAGAGTTVRASIPLG